MLIQTRERLIKSKLSNTSSINKASILSSNPQMQELVHKLLTISQIQQKPINFNLMQWSKQKYQPSDMQNRMKIQNQISLKQIRNQKIRTKIKPNKKRTLSVNITSYQQTGKSYKQHYQQIKQQQHQQLIPKPQEEQEQNQVNQSFDIHHNPTKQGIKYYDTLKRYRRIFNFIQDRIQVRTTQKEKKLRTFSQTLPTSIDSKQIKPKIRQFTKQTSQQANDSSNKRIHTLMNKWKPKPKLSTIIPRYRNKTSNNIISKEDIEFGTILNSTIEIQSSLFNSKIKGTINTRRFDQN